MVILPQTQERVPWLAQDLRVAWRSGRCSSRSPNGWLSRSLGAHGSAALDGATEYLADGDELASGRAHAPDLQRHVLLRLPVDPRSRATSSCLAHHGRSGCCEGQWKKRTRAIRATTYEAAPSSSRRSPDRQRRSPGSSSGETVLSRGVAAAMVAHSRTGTRRLEATRGARSRGTGQSLLDGHRSFPRIGGFRMRALSRRDRPMLTKISDTARGLRHRRVHCGRAAPCRWPFSTPRAADGPSRF